MGLAGRDHRRRGATPLVPFLPVVMFAILFGLSMDYEVFILSRVRERITAGDEPSEATLHGSACPPG